MVQRNTWQRERVRSALAGAPGFVSAQDLHAELRGENTGIGLATVYRACASTGHHHHLICRVCGKAVEIHATEVETWAQRTAAAHGFTQAEHVVDIFGTCADCTAATSARADA